MTRHEYLPPSDDNDGGSDDSEGSGVRAAEYGLVTNRFGKYGLIQECDKSAKLPEFYAWLTEVLGQSHEGLGSHDERRLFMQFIEEYNTATMPSKKFYDVDAWDERHANKKREPIKPPRPFDDEKYRTEELRRQREADKHQETEEALAALRRDAEALQDMQKQKELQMEVSYLYRTGQTRAARTLQSKLNAETSMSGTTLDDKDYAEFFKDNMGEE